MPAPTSLYPQPYDPSQPSDGSDFSPMAWQTAQTPAFQPPGLYDGATPAPSSANAYGPSPSTSPYGTAPTLDTFLSKYAGPNPLTTPAPTAPQLLPRSPFQLNKPNGWALGLSALADLARPRGAPGPGALQGLMSGYAQGNAQRLQAWEANDRNAGQYNAQQTALYGRQVQERQAAGNHYGTLANAYQKTINDLQGKNLADVWEAEKFYANAAGPDSPQAMAARHFREHLTMGQDSDPQPAQTSGPGAQLRNPNAGGASGTGPMMTLAPPSRALPGPEAVGSNVSTAGPLAGSVLPARALGPNLGELFGPGDNLARGLNRTANTDPTQDALNALGKKPNPLDILTATPSYAYPASSAWGLRERNADLTASRDDAVRLGLPGVKAKSEGLVQGLPSLLNKGHLENDLLRTRNNNLIGADDRAEQRLPGQMAADAAMAQERRQQGSAATSRAQNYGRSVDSHVTTAGTVAAGKANPRVLGLMPEIEASARQYGVDPTLVAGVIDYESGGRPEAVNGVHTGLGQFGPAERAHYGGNGVDATAHYLSDLVRKDGSVEGALHQYGDQTPPYVGRVLARAGAYQTKVHRGRGAGSETEDPAFQHIITHITNNAKKMKLTDLEGTNEYRTATPKQQRAMTNAWTDAASTTMAQ